MKNLPDLIEKHVIYFLTGFVAVISTSLVVFSLYAFMFVPMMFLGNYYFLIIPTIATAMYYIGKKILKGNHNGN